MNRSICTDSTDDYIKGGQLCRTSHDRRGCQLLTGAKATVASQARPTDVGLAHLLPDYTMYVHRPAMPVFQQLDCMLYVLWHLYNTISALLCTVHAWPARLEFK